MNFLHSSALKAVSAVLTAALIGCGPNDGSREFEQAKEAYAVRNLEKAAKLFEKSVSVSPADVDRLLYLARVKLDLGELAAAKDAVERASLNSDGDADVGMLAAQIAWHMKDYKAAANGFSLLANDKRLEPALCAQAWSALGVVEMTCENAHLARVAFLRALRLDRKNAAAWYHLGLLYRDSFGYLEAALEQFEIFVRLEVAADPRVQKVQRTVIPALKEAIAQTTAERPGASKRNAAACATAIAKAEAATKKGRTKDAVKAWQEAFSADALSYPAAIGLARAYGQSDAKKSFEAYRAACALRPSAVSTFVTTGALAAKLGFHSQAVEIYSRAVAASPASIDALDGLIRALRKVGGKANVAKAYQLYRESIPVKRK